MSYSSILAQEILKERILLDAQPQPIELTRIRLPKSDRDKMQEASRLFLSNNSSIFSSLQEDEIAPFLAKYNIFVPADVSPLSPKGLAFILGELDAIRKADPSVKNLKDLIQKYGGDESKVAVLQDEVTSRSVEDAIEDVEKTALQPEILASTGLIPGESPSTVALEPEEPFVDPLSIQAFVRGERAASKKTRGRRLEKTLPIRVRPEVVSVRETLPQTSQFSSVRAVQPQEPEEFKISAKDQAKIDKGTHVFNSATGRAVSKTSPTGRTILRSRESS